MRIAVFGTGMVGQAIAARCDELGHDVTVGTRDPAASRARKGADGASEGSFGAWLDAHPAINLATYAEAAAASELVVNATSGQVALAALGAAGEDNLVGKILIDISNPLDFSAGFP
ncbi:MAG: NAD(P)-binding domain-containing protein, partial [Actinobacteria bacterium]|nr:NAD(P)-binding domain-containing protein [Actinomycetota bacterium]